MRIETFIFLFAILLPGIIFGQSTFESKQENVYDSLPIENIQSLVDSIRLDRNLEILSIDSVSFSSKFPEDTVLFNVDIHQKGNEIVRISLSSCGTQISAPYGIGHSRIHYFLDKNQLIFVEEKYTDRSRMGSCGTLSIENRLYYQEGSLLKAFIIESPFTCYSSPIKTDWLFENFKVARNLGLKKLKE